MIASLISRLLAASAYRKVMAVLLAGCVGGFVLGQAAHQQLRGIAARVTNPARSVAVISGALGVPAIAPHRTTVTLSPSHSTPGNDDGDHGGEHSHDANLRGDELPHAMPLGQHGHEHGNGHGGGDASAAPLGPTVEED